MERNQRKRCRALRTCLSVRACAYTVYGNGVCVDICVGGYVRACVRACVSGRWGESPRLVISRSGLIGAAMRLWPEIDSNLPIS